MKVGTQLRVLASTVSDGETLSQARVAMSAGVAEHTVGRLFNNRNKTIAIREKVVEAMGCEIVIRKKVQ